MVGKKLLFIITIYILDVAIGFSDDKSHNPTYHKSSISSRFVKFEQNTQIEFPELQRINNRTFKAVLPETLNVMAIRVQFQRDNDRNTTGNGWFHLSDTDSAIINPPPHNYLYFSNQLLALQDYYRKVSQGKLFLNITDQSGKFAVYPQQSDSIWTLAQLMSYYNPNTSEDELDQRLAELFCYAIEIADKNRNIIFYKFDVDIIFHDGVG